MIWLVVLMALLFEGLAVCTIGAMVTSGINASLAMATAVLELTLGAPLIKAMYGTANGAKT